MKFYNYDIVFQEIPDEVTLAINITNCPNRCLACHSPHLWEDVGTELTVELIDTLIAKYDGLITCVCLMGGDGDVATIVHIARHLRTHRALNIGWYSGRTEFPPVPELFDYVKLGPYRPEMGGLNVPTTNQRLYRRVEDQWVDITHRFLSNH